MPWVVAVAAAVAFTLALYSRPPRPSGWPALVAAVCRAAAVLLIVALVLDAPVGAARAMPRWAAMDLSASMRRGDTSSWRAAAESLAAVGAESVFVFGDSARPFSTPRAPSDDRSEIRALADRAIAAGRALIVVTDGELPGNAPVAGLPYGSRIVRVEKAPVVDAAVVAIDVPRAVVAGDSLRARITIVAGEARTPAGELDLVLDGKRVATARFDAMIERSERQVEVGLVATGPAGPALMTAIVRAPGDKESRNDSLSLAIDRSTAATAVLVSSAPDFDARYALAVLRGSVGIATRAYFRVSPGQWRLDGPLTPVTESEVKRALSEAPLAIIHGDTTVFGPPRSLTLGPMALAPTTGSDAEGEWYTVLGPVSPLMPSLSGIGWDSLPPVAIGSNEPTGEWKGVEARRGRGNERRAVIVGSEKPKRTVVVNARGLWRWKFRGGSSADAFAAVWGSVFDWLAQERVDRRAAVPDQSGYRAGETIRWRRGSAADTVVDVVLRRRNAPMAKDSIRLSFASAATLVETPPLPEGTYDVSTRGGVSLLVVNPSREWLPPKPSVAAGRAGSDLLSSEPRGLRGMGWPFVAVVVLLCAEWLLRRRAGLR